MAAHFNSKGHSLQDLSIFVIEQIHREEVSYCRAKEVLDSDSPIAGPRGTQSQSIGEKTWRNNGLVDTVLNLVDSKDNFRTY